LNTVPGKTKKVEDSSFAFGSAGTTPRAPGVHLTDATYLVAAIDLVQNMRVFVRLSLAEMHCPMFYWFSYAVKNFVGPLTPRGTVLNLEQIWHTDRDNLEAVDPATLGDLTAIIKAFVVEYYALEP
jgi:hypothetical protein